MRKILLALILMTLSLSAQESYQKEINHLLEYVKTTQCSYIRNGDSYTGDKAVSHIQRKYDYFKPTFPPTHNEEGASIPKAW